MGDALAIPEASQRVPNTLVREYPHGDIDGAQRRRSDREAESRIDARRDEQDGPSHSRHGDHDPPPAAEHQPYEKQRRNHTDTIVRRAGETARANTGRITCLPVADSKRLPCDACGAPMEPEHAHYRCPACGYIQPCCGW